MSVTPRVPDYRIVKMDNDEERPWVLYWGTQDEQSFEEYETLSDVLDRIRELEEEDQ